MTSVKVSTDTFTFRAGVPSDAHLLLSTWLKSYRNAAPVTAIPNKVYFECHQDLIIQILGGDGTAVTVICAKDDPDQILGYAVYNQVVPLMHYIYVKFPFRKLGLGKLLLQVAQSYHVGKTLHCTHIAKDWKSVSRRFNLAFNPYFTSVSITDKAPANDQPSAIAPEADRQAASSAELV